MIAIHDDTVRFPAHECVKQRRISSRFHPQARRLFTGSSPSRVPDVVIFTVVTRIHAAEACADGCPRPEAGAGHGGEGGSSGCQKWLCEIFVSTFMLKEHSATTQ